MRKHLVENTNWKAALFSLALAAITWLLPLGLEPRAQTVLAIVILAGALWFTDAIPLHVTALAVPLLLAVLASFPTADALAPFFDPVVVLLLGGFVLATAIQKHGVDEYIARRFLSRFGNTPRRFLLGLMAITAFVSFWMSNTATTALMMPIAIAALAGFKGKSYPKAVVLGVAYAATIGGMATLIGSTPNVIAAKFLADRAITLSFADWLVRGLPLALVLLVATWLTLLWLFPADSGRLRVAAGRAKLTPPQKWVLAVFGITAALWIATGTSTANAALVAIVPIILLYALNLLETSDFSKSQWAALILVGGGISLGSAMGKVGLDLFFADKVIALATGQHPLLVLMAIAAFAIIITVVASNTAAASLLIPIALPFAAGLGLGLKNVAMLAGLGVSMDFVVPVGTPPNAIAYSTGRVKISEMIKAGLVVSLIGLVVLSLMAWLLW